MTKLRNTAAIKKSGYRVIQKWECEYSDEEKSEAKQSDLVQAAIPKLMPKDAFYGAGGVAFQEEFFKGYIHALYKAKLETSGFSRGAEASLCCRYSGKGRNSARHGEHRIQPRNAADGENRAQLILG